LKHKFLAVGFSMRTSMELSMRSIRTPQQLTILIGVLFCMGVSQQARAEKFEIQCDFPKAASGKVQRVDRQCGVRGVGDTDAHLAQNTAKNNFCAQAPIATLTRDDFVKLQDAAAAAGVRFGSREELPEDRRPLDKILRLSDGTRVGEG